MAGDWIKMRSNLWDDPRVTRLVDITDSGEAAVVGGLYWLWSTADQHSINGVLPGLSVKGIDRKTGVPGLGQGLVMIGWLEDHAEGVRVINFEEHNGASAKQRAQTSRRVAKYKASSDELPSESPPQVTPPAQTGNAPSVTPPLPERYLEKELEIDLEKKKKEREGASPAGSRLPTDWALPQDWAEWAKQERPELNPAQTAERFADYWHGVAGAKGRKADWLATWRNWVRNEKVNAGMAAQAQAETAYQRAMRERAAEFAPDVARQSPADYQPAAFGGSAAIETIRPLRIA